MSLLLVRKFTRKVRGRKEEVLRAVRVEKPTMTVVVGCGENSKLKEIPLQRRGYQLHPMVDATSHFQTDGQVVGCKDEAYGDTVAVRFRGKVAGWVSSPDGPRLIRFSDNKDITPVVPEKS